ncbi:hypothetical protein DV736_g3044, partial [Chaetothyriales sp. CBS 134916]
MRLVKRNIDRDGSGFVVLHPEEPEDMWHAYNLIRPGDLLTASAIRRVVNETTTSSTSQRVHTKLTIRVKSLDFDAQAGQLHVSGQITRENRFTKIGQFHTLDLELLRDFTLEKEVRDGSEGWDSVARAQLDEAVDPNRGTEAVAIVMQEGLANICFITQFQTVLKQRIEVSIPRKRAGIVRSADHDKGLQKFFGTVLDTLLRQLEGLMEGKGGSTAFPILVASPGFTAAGFVKYVSETAASRGDKILQDLVKRKAFLLIHSSSGHLHSLKEVLQNPAVLAKLKDTKYARETGLMDEFFALLRKDDGRAWYGHKEVERAVDKGAVGRGGGVLMISHGLFRSQDVATRRRWVHLVDRVRDDEGGEIRILSSDHESGKSSACPPANMAAAKAPAMTTRQAKRLGKKQTAQFQFTASQLSRADRQEESEKREKKKQEREQRKVLNKRKREEQEEKQRAVKRRLLEEGKISIEDTWARVTRSQSRLHSYFTEPIEQAVKSPTTPSTVVTVSSEDRGGTPANRLVDAAEDKENQKYRPGDSQPKVLTSNHPPLAPPINSTDEMSDCHCLKVASHPCNLHLRHRSPPMSSSIKSMPSSMSSAKTKNNVSTVRIKSSGSSMSSHSASSETTDAKEKEELLLLLANFEDEIIVAEDETAEIVQGQPAESDARAESFSAPPDSFRSALSEMTVANENADPLHIYTAKAKMKATAKLAVHETEKSEAGPSSCRKRLLPSRPHPCKQDDFEDIYDEDFDTGEDDGFADDGVDDATLMTLSTQRPPTTDRIVDVHGSPHRLTTSRDVLVKPRPLTYTSGKTMPGLPPTSRPTTLSKARASTHASSADRWAKESLSFNSICDDEWLDIAEKVEEELSQKHAAASDAAKGKERERLPPPPSNTIQIPGTSLGDSPAPLATALLILVNLLNYSQLLQGLDDLPVNASRRIDVVGWSRASVLGRAMHTP